MNTKPRQPPHHMHWLSLPLSYGLIKQGLQLVHGIPAPGVQQPQPPPEHGVQLKVRHRSNLHQRHLWEKYEVRR